MKRNLFPIVVAASVIGGSLLAQTSPVSTIPTTPASPTVPTNPTVSTNPATPGSPPAVSNVSLRSTVANDGSSIVGFVITGTATHTVLIRAVGPTLAQLGVLDVLDRPILALYHDRQLLAVNSGWGTAPSIPAGQGTGVVGNATSAVRTSGGTVPVGGAATTGELPDGAAFTVRAATMTDFAQAGAFGLPAGSSDAALVASLPPGAYTVVVTGGTSAAVGSTATSGTAATTFGTGSTTLGGAGTGSSSALSSVATGTGLTTSTNGTAAPTLATPLNAIGTTTIGNTTVGSTAVGNTTIGSTNIGTEVGNVSTPNGPPPAPSVSFTARAGAPPAIVSIGAPPPSFGNVLSPAENGFSTATGGEVLIEVYFLD